MPRLNCRRRLANPVAMVNRMSDHRDIHVHSAARVAATLRTVLAGFRDGGDRALPLLVAEQEGGVPEAVVLPYELFVTLEHGEDAAVGELAAHRLALAPQPGGGLDNAALARLVAAESPDEADEILRADGASKGQD